MRTEKKKIMNTNKMTASIVGVLFITAMVTSIIGLILLGPILDAQDYLIKFSENENQVIIGAILTVIMGAACAGISISMFPVLKKYNKTMALGAIGFRIIESVFHMIVAFAILLLLSLAHKFVEAGTPDNTYFQTLSELLLISIHEWLVFPMVFAFSLGALMYYYLFYRSKLVPRWLAGWGIVSIILILVNSIFSIFGYYSNMSPVAILLNLPLAINEIVLAVWLIVKGFNFSAIATKSE